MATTADAGSGLRVVEAERPKDQSTLDQERRFYAVAAFAMLAITAVGFRQFLLHGKATGGEPMTPQIVGLVVVHGLAMLGWVVLLCVQCTLVVASRRRLHVRLGKIGAFLAGAVVILGVMVAPLSAHYNPASYADFGGARYFLGLIWAEPVTFGVFVTVGIAYRARPEVHRPMVLLGTVGLMAGPFSRVPYWDPLVRFADGSIAVAMFGQTLALGAILLLAHLITTRRTNRYFLAGYCGLAIASTISAVVARSAAWNHVAGLIVR